MPLQRFCIRQTSDFNLYNRWGWESSAAAEDVMGQRQEEHFNALRVWTGYDIPLIGRCIPRERPGFYERIPEFMSVCAQHGFYVEWTAFTGKTYDYYGDVAGHFAHWERLDHALDGLTNVLDLEAVNEGDHGADLGPILYQLRRPTGKLASHGSNIQQNPPIEPTWDVAGYRPGTNEWWRQAGHGAMERIDQTHHIPGWSNETPRIPDLDNNPIHAYDAGAVAALLCSGICGHTPEGKNSTLWAASSLTLMREMIRGCLSVPLEFQAGRYSRIEPPYPPGIIRIYRRTLADGRFKEVQVRE